MKLLFVDCCISQRGAESRTRVLAEAFLDAFRDSHPDTEVEVVVQEELLALIDKLNQDDAVNGILVQLPVPPHINDDKIIQAKQFTYTGGVRRTLRRISSSCFEVGA